jgi:hypothetical protein
MVLLQPLKVFNEAFDLFFGEHGGEIGHGDEFVSFDDGGLRFGDELSHVIFVDGESFGFAVSGDGLFASRRILETGADELGAIDGRAGAAEALEYLGFGEVLLFSDESLAG